MKIAVEMKDGTRRIYHNARVDYVPGFIKISTPAIWKSVAIPAEQIIKVEETQ